MPDFAAIQDWMCEPFMLAKTGRSLEEHQSFTILSLLELRELAPEIPWLPVLQGWEADHYLNHIEKYAAAGVDLSAEPLVGVGSICRRQGTRQAARIIQGIASQRIRIHAFGVKISGLGLFRELIDTADSMAWSFTARREQLRLAGCEGHKNCANCFRWALQWRDRVVGASKPATCGRQLELSYGALS